MFGRDSRTLSKLFEGIVNTPDDCDRILLKAKEAVDAPKKKFIVGLMY